MWTGGGHVPFRSSGGTEWVGLYAVRCRACDSMYDPGGQTAADLGGLAWRATNGLADY